MFPKLLSRCLGPVCLAVLLLVAAGCSESARLLKVTGTVRYKGKPVPNVVVNFLPAEGRPSWGLTNDKGEFKLSIDKKTEGAVTGLPRSIWSIDSLPWTPPQPPPPHSGRSWTSTAKR